MRKKIIKVHVCNKETNNMTCMLASNLNYYIKRAGVFFQKKEASVD